MDSEEKYPEIRNKLKNLEQVKAGDDFVRKLHMKIVESESEKRHEHEARFDEPRGGFLKNLFGNMQYPWLAPAVGFTVLIFFVFYITYLNKTTSEKDRVSTSQKQESIEQKKPDENKNPSIVQDNKSNDDKTLTDKENQKEKDIAGDLKTERYGKEPSPVENNRGLTDRDDIKIYKEETKSFEPPKTAEEKVEAPLPETGMTSDESKDKIEGKIETKSSVKEKDDSEAIDNSGLRGLKKSESESKAPGDSDRTARGKIQSDSMKMGRRLKIDKTELEKIREEIVK